MESPRSVPTQRLPKVSSTHSTVHCWHCYFWLVHIWFRVAMAEHFHHYAETSCGVDTNTERLRKEMPIIGKPRRPDPSCYSHAWQKWATEYIRAKPMVLQCLVTLAQAYTIKLKLLGLVVTDYIWEAYLPFMPNSTSFGLIVRARHLSGA